MQRPPHHEIPLSSGSTFLAQNEPPAVTSIPPSAGLMRRRDFIRFAAAGATVAASGLVGVRELAAGPARPTPAPAPFVGIQIAPHTMLDEGIEHCLDFIQETAAVNCVMVYTHTYNTDLRKAILAGDHGVPPCDTRNRNFPAVWVKQHDQYFGGTSLRHPAVDLAADYASHDIMAELVEPCRKRGIKLYGRILEGSGQDVAARVKNFSRVATIDIYGKPTFVACWNHPEYKIFWNATVEDMFRSYDLDGLQWGAERMGPLINVIMPWTDAPPTCFCEHCRSRAAANGINAERARQGYEELYLYVRARMAGAARPPDGIFTGFLRILLRYPEILSWEYQYRLAREEVMQGMYNTIKNIKPSADVGWHIDHEPSSFDPIYRAEMSYAEMAPYSDYLKFIAYHDVLGPRIRSWYLDRLQKSVLGELSLEESLGVYYDIFGYDKTVEPKVAALDRTGFSPDYVYRETRRSVASAAGKTRILTGIGFDVPWESRPIPADPEKVYQSVRRAFDAGAAGIVVSRDYAEMHAANLKAVGRAIREMAGGQGKVS